MKRFVVFLAAIFVSSCAPASLLTIEGAAGSAMGAGLGAASGLILGEQDSSFDGTKSALAGAGIGAGLGLLAGGLAYESGMFAPPQKPALRVPLVGQSEIQSEIDNLRYEYDESMKWGRGELKPWDERIYDNSNYPYEGVSSGY